MAFRIGKSVMLNFGTNLEPIFIFAGLAFLLLIGPLLRWYVLAMTKPNYKLSKSFFLEIIPFLVVFILSLFIREKWFDTKNEIIIVLFGGVLIGIYIHFAFYIFMSWRILKNIKKEYKNSEQTKSQKVIIYWLGILLIGFAIIWVSYFFNIIENTVPYITGPIMYAIAVYFLSFKAFQLKVTDIDGNAFVKNDDSAVFSKMVKLIVENKLYLEPYTSLSSVSKLIGKSTQKVSEIINQYAKQNFNDFINYYRVQEAKKMLSDEDKKKYTISSVAFDSGFSSLSSFNSAFKKFEGQTPSSYRKKVFFE
ncbi:helix-turn-helix domain-containing protein [uncultured Maribacter sp.]|uniref:helix-turn-helix domain-containing protein n=1 Tax=uncultured Maribacter sp. TaxID=431308 RepID=UPI002638A58E|nr:helix-turn-helix domain-containing protein [uncultured Maribacter sp.]